MMYPYITLADETEITHSQLLPDHSVQVHFERPKDGGFDSARCVLPAYTWTARDGFSDNEIEFFEQLLHSNAHLLYHYAENGGIRCA